MRASRSSFFRDVLALALPVAALVGACTLPTSGTSQNPAVFSTGGSSAVVTSVAEGAGGAGGAPILIDGSGPTSSATGSSATSSTSSGTGGTSTTSGAGGATSTSASTTTTTTASTTSTGGPTCDDGANCQDCAACAVGSSGDCSIQYNGCIAKPECNALLNCVFGCGGNQGCQQQCWNDHPNGTGAFSALGTCIACACPTLCPDLGCQ
jgi:hypothetical protein